ncbi:hypothetical protein B9Z19DRAFT_1090632 [Tuber borchii]|uniref:Uncharacterized protein n=1 Tax=Tuber borchii TaxID=42251 RepID=A0A2T6ZIH2_TUBBO|nr:hypothetical protein B9Z19DRAFT_1090632 [Tuber borchii]
MRREEKYNMSFVCIVVIVLSGCCVVLGIIHGWVESSVMVLLGRARVPSSLAVLLCMFPTVILGFSSIGAVPVPCRV